jgi:protein SCO1/2
MSCLRFMLRVRPLLLLFCVGLGFAACRRAPSNAPVAAEQRANYDARGVVRKVDREANRAVIAHEEIPGYMEAMAMEFSVPDPQDLAILQPGDSIAFQLSVTETRSWISRVQTIAKAAVPIPAAVASEGGAPGAPIPDCLLLDQDNQRFRLSDFKGSVLAITFIFTRCPLPDFCPRMSEQFSAVQREFLAGDAKWHLLSVSIDPAYDTPERLAAYAARDHADPTRWTFATGETSDIDNLTSVFGLRAKREGAELNHTLRTVVVDGAGRVRKVFAGNEWKPAELIDEMTRALASAR